MTYRRTLFYRRRTFVSICLSSIFETLNFPKKKFNSRPKPQGSKIQKKKQLFFRESKGVDFETAGVFDYSFRGHFLYKFIEAGYQGPFYLSRKPLTYEIEEHEMPGINKWGSGQDEDDDDMDLRIAEDAASSSDHSPFHPDPLRTDHEQQPCSVSPQQNPTFLSSSPGSQPSSPPQPSTSPDNVGGSSSDQLPDDKSSPVIPEEVLRQRIEERVQKETEEKAKTSFSMRQVLKDQDDFRDRLSVAFALLEYLEEFQQRLRNNPDEFYCSVELNPNSSNS